MLWWRRKELEQDLDRELRSDLDLDLRTAGKRSVTRGCAKRCPPRPRQLGADPGGRTRSMGLDIGGTIAARRALCHPAAEETVGLHPGGPADPRPRDRRQCRHVQRHPGGVDRAAPLSPRRPADVPCRLDCDGRTHLLLLSGRPRLAAPDPSLRESRRVSVLRLHHHGRGRDATVSGAGGFRFLLLHARSHPGDWPRFPSAGRPAGLSARGDHHRSPLAPVLRS